MRIAFFLLMGILFIAMLVRGVATGRMPGKFGPTLRDKEPIFFVVSGAVLGLFALVCFFAALSLSLQTAS